MTQRGDKEGLTAQTPGRFASGDRIFTFFLKLTFFFLIQQKTPAIPLNESRSSPFERPNAQRAEDEKSQPGSDLKHASLLMLKMREGIKNLCFSDRNWQCLTVRHVLEPELESPFSASLCLSPALSKRLVLRGHLPASLSPKGLSLPEVAVFLPFISAWVTGILYPGS